VYMKERLLFPDGINIKDLDLNSFAD
jgi:hypothetical protein